jgi:hypothetical protein
MSNPPPETPYSPNTYILLNLSHPELSRPSDIGQKASLPYDDPLAPTCVSSTTFLGLGPSAPFG